MYLFGYSSEEDYVEANFTTDTADALPGEDIQFMDWSIGGGDTGIVSWAWDLDEDGIMDSEDQNPVWSYDQGGNYNIMLIVSNGQDSNTLIRKDVVIVRPGIFVYEGEENGVDLSGTYIRDYLEINGYEVVYANRFPSDLWGFDIIFTSFGSNIYNSPVLTEDIAYDLREYGLLGGYIYLEGAQALEADQAGNIPFWSVFGIEQVDNGSYNSINALENLEDGDYPNTRDELLNRILGFFNFTNGIDEQVHLSVFNVQAYPYPVSARYPEACVF